MKEKNIRMGSEIPKQFLPVAGKPIFVDYNR